MSVVNKMLQDLEQRQQAEASYSGDYQPSQHGNRRWWLFAAATLILGILAILLFSQGLRFGETPQATVASKAEQQQAEIVSTAVPVSAPAEEIEQTDAESQAPEVDSSFTEQEPQSPQVITAEEPDLVVIDEPEPSMQNDNRQNNQASFRVSTTEVKGEPEAPAAFEVSSNKAQDPGQLFRQQAQTALRKGDDRQAIVALEGLLNVEPDNHIARKKLAALLFASGQDTQAKSLLQQGLQDDASRVDIRQMLARLYVQQQQPEAAFKLLSEFSVDAMQDTDYVALRASLAQQLGKYSDAKLDYQALVEAQQDNPQWWLGLAICEDKLGASNQALAAYRKVIALQQISPAVSEFSAQRIASLSGVK
jgi:MSHA biogenesis protein MshN